MLERYSVLTVFLPVLSALNAPKGMRMTPLCGVGLKGAP